MKYDTDESLNVLDGPLKPCSFDPMTSFFRDGCCNTNPGDVGSHTVCAAVSQEFLAHQKGIGNDLTGAFDHPRGITTQAADNKNAPAAERRGGVASFRT